MSRDINPFGLRMPNELKEHLDEAAKENGRSLNAEINQRLTDSFEHQEELLEANSILNVFLPLFDDLFKGTYKMVPCDKNDKKRFEKLKKDTPNSLVYLKDDE